MLNKLLKNQSGFTLLEAMISVVIVGIVIVPISMIFMGALDKAMDAKEKLRANELAQLYIENLKQRPYDEFVNTFVDVSTVTGGSVTITDTDFGADNYYLGFPKASYSDNYEVIISYHKDFSDYGDYALASSHVPINNYDIVIDINSNSVSDGIIIDYPSDYVSTHGSHANKDNPGNALPPVIDMTINSTNYTIEGHGYSKVNGSNNILINCNADIGVVPEVKFNITNETIVESNIYIYREDDSKVVATVKSLEGKNYRHYNLTDSVVTSAEFGIVTMDVYIRNIHTNEEVAHVYATKIYE